jgi:hypothetical protein
MARRGPRKRQKIRKKFDLVPAKRPRDAVRQHLLPSCCRPHNALVIKGLHPRDRRNPWSVWRSGNMLMLLPNFPKRPLAGELQISQRSMAFTVALNWAPWRAKKVEQNVQTGIRLAFHSCVIDDTTLDRN